MITKPPARFLGAFSLLETLIAFFVLSLSVGGIFAGLAKLNEYAVINRLYTSGLASAQARIDRSLVDKPYDPLGGFVHPDLESKTEVNKNLTIYADPAATGSNGLLVTGTMTTVISSVSTPVASGTAYGNITLQRTSVTVAYQFKGKPYSIQLTCLRSPDTAQ